LAKNRLPETAPSPIVIFPLKDSILCPVRSLRIYLNLTGKSRKPQDPLFLHYSPGKKSSSQLLSSWIRGLIRSAYDSAATKTQSAETQNTDGPQRLDARPMLRRRRSLRPPASSLLRQ
jgi:hypothetical protein